MSNVHLVDSFPNNGLEIIPGSMLIKDHNGMDVLSSVYSLTGPLAGYNQGFELSFNSPITNYYTISYKTNFNNDELLANKDQFKNSANLKWTECIKPNWNNGYFNL